MKLTGFVRVKAFGSWEGEIGVVSGSYPMVSGTQYAIRFGGDKHTIAFDDVELEQLDTLDAQRILQESALRAQTQEQIK